MAFVCPRSERSKSPLSVSWTFSAESCAPATSLQGHAYPLLARHTRSGIGNAPAAGPALTSDPVTIKLNAGCHARHCDVRRGGRVIMRARARAARTAAAPSRPSGGPPARASRARAARTVQCLLRRLNMRTAARRRSNGAALAHQRRQRRHRRPRSQQSKHGRRPLAPVHHRSPRVLPTPLHASAAAQSPSTSSPAGRRWRLHGQRAHTAGHQRRAKVTRRLPACSSGQRTAGTTFLRRNARGRSYDGACKALSTTAPAAAPRACRHATCCDQARPRSRLQKFDNSPESARPNHHRTIYNRRATHNRRATWNRLGCMMAVDNDK